MTYSNSTPKVFVLAKTNAAHEKISQALTTEPVRVIHLTEGRGYSDALDDLEAACILVEIVQDSVEDLDAITALQATNHTLPLIAVSTQWTISDAVRAIKSGADDVCDLQTQLAELRTMIHKAIATEQPRRSELREVIPASIIQKLDSEEARIVHLIALGLTAKEIGSALDVSIRTYHYRKKTIFQKLGIANRSDLIELIRTSNGRITEWHSSHPGPASPHLRRPTFLSQSFLET
ncbi:MAG: LuxR C-terminal-related transcriptional regulator [Pirellula sp.]|jgi:DNA-binding NarL/FixJ family response regulator|nr:LuxR C-terminal-related transcriptional regulator [Pirellula sp.]